MPKKPTEKLLESFKQERSDREKQDQSAKLKREIERLIQQIETGKI